MTEVEFREMSEKKENIEKLYKLLQRVCTPKWQEISILYPYTTLLTGKSGRTSFNNRSPNIWSQYLAIFSCWCREQWFSKDKITGYSDVTNAQSRIAYITSCNEKKIGLDISLSMHNSKYSFVSNYNDYFFNALP